MFCPKCGKSLNDVSRFCPGCGASLEAVTYVKESERKISQPEKNKPLYQQGTEISKTPVKKKTSAAAIVFAAVALVLAVILILQNIGVLGLASGSNISGKKFEGTGYNSAEEAVLAYIDAFKDGDVSAMLQTFAIETYNDNLDTEARIKYLQSYSTSLLYDFPLYESDYEWKYLVYTRVGELARSIEDQIWSQEGGLWEAAGGVSRTWLLDDSSDIHKTLAEFKNYDQDQFVSSVTFVEFLDPATLCEEFTSRDYWSSNSVKIREKNYITGGFGLDEYQDVAAHITIKGEDYLLCMGCARYGEKWYNAFFSGFLGIYLNLNIYQAGLVSYDKLTEARSD